MLKETELNKGSLKQGNELVPLSTGVSTGKLSDMGISHNDSSKWQRIATLEEDKFEEVIEDIKTKGKELNKGSATPSTESRALPKLKDFNISYNDSSKWQLKKS